MRFSRNAVQQKEERTKQGKFSTFHVRFKCSPVEKRVIMLVPSVFCQSGRVDGADYAELRNMRIKVEEKLFPSLEKEGWTRPQENIAKPPCWERTGWFVELPIIGGLNQPPRLRELMWLREIFLIAQPPLLVQGGELTRINPDLAATTARLRQQAIPCGRCNLRAGRD